MRPASAHDRETVMPADPPARTPKPMIEALRGEASALALSIGEALAAQALREAPGEAIDQAIGRVLSQIARGQEVTVSVHPDLAEDIARTEQSLAPGTSLIAPHNFQLPADHQVHAAATGALFDQAFAVLKLA